ncbi:MAG: hypothetical protein EOM40_10020 [Clostridia bacterium]|nr:hypothetical protein [Clostridia bacterium]
MKKKTIVMYVIAGVFILSAFSGFSSGSITGGVGCIVLAGVFGFLGYRSSSVKSVSQPAATPAATTDNSPVKEFYSFKLAGVTFNNDDGTSRQNILRAIHFKDAPFTDGVELGLNAYTYEGQPAYAVTADGQQVGNVPRDCIQYISDNFERIEAITHIEVYGGGRSQGGEKISYGAEVTLRLSAK